LSILKKRNNFILKYNLKGAVLLSKKEDEKYTDFSTVEARHRYIIPEELPEGPYGSPVNNELGKSTPWEEDQRTYSAFNYTDKSAHEETDRKYPGAHPPHDNPAIHEEKPS
jgi:hypothetical protein